MGIQQKQIDYAKEVDDVLVLVVELVKDIKAKKDMAALAAENLPNLMNAIGGLDQVGDEFKNKQVVLSTVGYRVGELSGALIDG